MKAFNFLFVIGAALFLMVVTGCRTQGSQLTSPYHPGPTLGHAVGAGVGVVGGNVVGVAVGTTEGLVQGVAAPFSTTTRVVRRWRTQVTADGRTIQVPEDILVDANGQPVGKPAKK